MSLREVLEAEFGKDELDKLEFERELTELIEKYIDEYEADSFLIIGMLAKEVYDFFS